MKKIIKEIYPYILVLIAVILVRTYVIAPVQVNGDSMYSTLHDDDIMLLNKLSYKLGGLNRFDIVVIRHEGRNLIKRIIGLPGEKLKVEDNKLYINDKYVEQDFLEENTKTEDFELKEEIPAGYYFVMGDNREVSLDSRAFGLFSVDDIEGKAALTIFPFDRIGFKK